MLLLVTSLTSDAQDQVIKFQNYNKDEGLLHSYVLDVIQDKDGYIWIGSYGGLNRFDGMEFTSYNVRTSSDMQTNVIQSIFESSSTENILWLGTDRGLLKFDRATSNFTLHELPETSIINIEEGMDGNLWIGTAHKGLMKFNIKSSKYEPCALTKSKDGEWGSQVKAIHKDIQGNLWISGNNTGLIKYYIENNSYERFLIPNKIGAKNSNTINCIYNFQNRLLLGSEDRGLVVFNTQKLRFDQPTYLNGIAPIRSNLSGIAPDHSGDLWLSSLGGGMFELDLEVRSDTLFISSYEQYTKNSCGSRSLPNNIIDKLYKDQTGNFWIGTLGGGLSKIDFYNHKFGHYKIMEESTDRFDESTALSVGKDKKGNIWYGTQADGVYIYGQNLKQIAHLPLTTTDGENVVVREIYTGQDGTMWLGLNGALCAIDPNNYESKFHDISDSTFGTAAIHGIAISNGKIWYGGYDVGVFSMDLPKDPMSSSLTNQKSYYHTREGGQLSNNQVWAVYADDAGQIWAGNSKALELYDPVKDRFDPVLMGNINSMYESETVTANVMWLGTYGGGLILMDKQDYSIIAFTSENGLDNDNINGILEDQNGTIWVGTEKGICSVDPNGLYNVKLSSLSDEQRNNNRVRTYFAHDGLQGHEYNLRANEGLDNGNLVFGGPRGLNIFDPKGIIDNAYVFPVKISDILINNKSITLDSTFTEHPEYVESLSLEYEQNYLTVEFSQVCLSTPEKAKYQYMLEGYDTDWITIASSQRRITYTSIPEGNYTLKLKSINPDGHVSEKVTKLAITVAPPWYRTFVFYTVVLLALALGFMVAYKMLNRRRERKHKVDLARQQHRYEVENLGKDLEYKTKELSASAMYLVNRNEKLIEVKDMLESTMRKMDGNTTGIEKTVDLIEKILKEKDNWDQFEKNFNLIDTDFTKRLTTAYPTLSKNDVKICTYMRMNLASKEIAGLLNIAPKSLETSRLRIRKKMELESGVYLSDFIIKF